MRRWCLIFGCLVAIPLAARADPTWPEEAQGYGLTAQEAKNDAIKKILEQLSAALHQHKPPLTAWQPTRDFVQRHLVVDEGRPGQDFLVENVGSTKTWILPVKPLGWAALTTLDQEAQRATRTRDRLSWGLFALAGYGLVLIVLTGKGWMNGYRK
jgi:hypothetical protein